MNEKKKRRFCLAVTSYNAMPWLQRSLESIAKQRYPNFSVCVVDDCSTQPGQRELIEYFCRKHGWTALLNEERLGPLATRVCAIEALNCDPEDIVVTIDGDDWLASPAVLDRLNAIYSGEKVWLTYGQYVRYPVWEWGHSRAFRRWVHRKGSYRKYSYRTSQLRSFLYSLWSSIEDGDLRDEDGEYYTHATDLAFMYPMLEMAGNRACFVDEFLYVYNRDTPLNEDKCERSEQDAAAHRIRQLPRYKRME